MIDQDYEASVADQFVALNTDALFKCHLSPSVRDFYQIVGWLEDGQRLLPTPSSVGQLLAELSAASGASKTSLMGPDAQVLGPQRSNALVLPDGQLYVQRVQMRDANKSFRCQIRSLLSGRTSTSSLGGRLFVTGEYSDSRRLVLGLSTSREMSIAAGRATQRG